MTSNQKNNSKKNVKKVSKTTENFGVEKVLQGMSEKDKKHLEVVMKKLNKIMNNYKTAVLKKFDKYIIGIALLPQNPKNKDDINTLVLVDDSDTKRMSKFELKNKITTILSEEAKKIDKNLKPQIWLLSEIWQNFYDGKTELLKEIALSTFFHDNGMLAALKIGEIHKEMVLKKFEKYIVSYVFAGSLVQGKATKSSDIDVFIVIDDTDVKKMTRVELKDKLRSIIISMGFEAGELTGIKNKLNVQTYILTDFWEFMKEANPIIFTFLRDGIPLYDRGIFMPWKQLLKMGRIKPSKEAIDMFMSTGDQMLSRMKFKIRDIGLEDCYWATLTPSQAALMLYGLPPPTPKECPVLLREVFVKKEKLLEEKYVKMFENILKVRKDIEHGTKKDVSGQEVDKLIKDSEDLLARLKVLFEAINTKKEKENVDQMSDLVAHLAREILHLEGVKQIKEENIPKKFQELLVDAGKIPQITLKNLKKIFDSKEKLNKKTQGKAETHKIIISTQKLIRELSDYLQRNNTIELERAKIRIKYGNKFAELTIIGTDIFIILDINTEKKQFKKGKLTTGGSLINVKKSSFEEYNKFIEKTKIIPKVYFKQALFKDLKNFFGKEIEIVFNH